MILKGLLAPFPCKVLCLGDSQTLAYTYGIKPTGYWPYQLKSQGVTSRYSMLDINCGNAGWSTSATATSSGLLEITSAQLTRYKPKVFIIYCGVNDPGNGIASGTTKTNIQSMIDLSYAAGIEYTMVVNTNYLNYTNASSGSGDNAAASSYYSAYVTVRAAQLAAATYGITTYGSSAVCHCDLFTYQKNLVLAGTWPQGSWQNSLIDTANQHMNANGQYYTGSFILSTLIANYPKIGNYKIS